MTPAQKNLLLRVARSLEALALAAYEETIAQDGSSRSLEKAKRKRDRELGDARDLRDLATSDAREIPPIDVLVSRFLQWPVPTTVRPDGVDGDPTRVGTNLLSGEESRAMFEYVLEVKS